MASTSGITNNTTDTTIGQTSAGSSASASSLDSVNFDTFLTLLVTQLKNQDPLNPMDGTQFTSQIAQFSQLEQQQKSNAYLEELLSQRDYGQQALASSYLGKEVLGPGDMLIKDDASEGFGYVIGSTAKTVEITVTDSNGQVVRTIKGDGTVGSHIAGWDGKDDDGNALPDDVYTLKITALDGDGKKVDAQTLTFGKVDSVLNDSKSSYVLLADDRQIAVEDILAVKDGKTVTAANGSDPVVDDGTGGDTSGTGETDETANNS